MWKTVKLGDALSIARGGSPRPIKSFITDADDGVNWIKIGDTTQGGRYIESTKEKIKPSGISRSRYVKSGDFLLSNSMSFGRPYILKTDGCIHDGWLVLSDYEEIFTADYLYYLLSSAVVQNQFEKLARGSTVRNLNTELVSSVVVSVPPLAEQQRIVAKLDAAFAEIDKAIEVAEAKLEQANNLSEATMVSIFSSVTNGTQTTLGETYDIRDGTHDSPKYVSKGYPLVTSKNLKTGLLDLSNVKYISEEDYIAINKRSAVHAGDVLMAMIGTIGNPIVITEEPSYSIKNVALFKTNKNQNPWFLKYYLEHPATKAQMQGDAKGTTQKFVGLGYLRNFPINVPAYETQDDIVEQISAVFKEIETLEQALKESIEAYEALKSAILTQELQPSQSEAA